MESQRFEVMERQLKRMERRLRGVVAGWIMSILGILVFGLTTHTAFPGPVTPDVLTVHGIKVVDEQGRERASIDAQGEIRGGVLRGGSLAIGDLLRGGGEFNVSSFATPGGHVIMRLEMESAEPGSAVFNVQTSGSGASLALQQGVPARYVQVTESRIEVGREGRTVWHAP